jgi:hypothetical protein
MKLAGLFALGLTLFLVGCGKPDLGDECDTVAAADECADTLVCANGGDSQDGKPTCQKACFTTADCQSNADCVPASGAETSASPLACRPR